MSALTFSPAHAAIKFRYYENSSEAGSFNMASANPNPCCGWIYGALTTLNVRNSTGIFSSNDGFFFLNASQGGGFPNFNEINFS